LGIITASVVSQLLTSKWEIADNATSRGLIDRLACEIATGISRPDSQSAAMANGEFMEPIARDYYQLATGRIVKEAGFETRELVCNIVAGASPDGYVGEDGLIEIKTRYPDFQFQTILAGIVPAEYLPQIQLQLLVTQRKWCDFVSFCDGMPLFIFRIYPDLKMQELLKAAITYAANQIQARANEFLEASKHMQKTQKIEMI
jgi:predicted phage-related endonuclease